MTKLRAEEASTFALSWQRRQLVVCATLIFGLTSSVIASESLDVFPPGCDRGEVISDSDRSSRSSRPYDELVSLVAREFDLDDRLLHAIIRVESDYRADAVSPKGAIGLMQVTPETGQILGYENLHDPETNLRAGATFLKSLLERFDNNLELAIAAYNAGEGAVRRCGCRVPPYSETQAYVRAVLARYRGSPEANPRDFSRREARSSTAPVERSSAGELLVKFGALLLSAPSVAQNQFDEPEMCEH
jgi:hypothetical protein